MEKSEHAMQKKTKLFISLIFHFRLRILNA